MLESSLRRKEFGAVETPPRIAQFLVRWAVLSPGDVVLDLGSGEGVFVVAAFQRLVHLGADRSAASQQLYGAETDKYRYRKLRQVLTDLGPGDFPHIYNGDFFHQDFPPVDAVISNPPYVRRMHLHSLEDLISRLGDTDLQMLRPPRLTDLYCYFVIRAASLLRPGGRLAVVISSSWMDVGYGVGFKSFLLRNFDLQAVIGLEGRIFADALVRPALLLAQKKEGHHDSRKVLFARAFNVRPHQRPRNNRGSIVRMTADELDPRLPWGGFLRSPKAFQELLSRHDLCPLGTFVDARIGIQTLARDFYVLTREDVAHLGIPDTHTLPLINSPRNVCCPVISEDYEPQFFVLFTDEPKSHLPASVCKYVEDAERRQVAIRGKGVAVTGYHQVPRLQAAGRNPGYNLKTELQRRGTYPILLPRRFYENFLVAWNRTNAIANENFIEPKPRCVDDTQLLLAVLNSSLFEFVARSFAEVYGGGVYNLNPSKVRNLPVPNIRRFSSEARSKLINAYRAFCSGGPRDGRATIDKALRAIVDWRSGYDELVEGVRQMIGIALAAKDY